MVVYFAAKDKDALRRMIGLVGMSPVAYRGEECLPLVALERSGAVLSLTFGRPRDAPHGVCDS